jgi:hypothetical protein
MAPDILDAVKSTLQHDSPSPEAEWAELMSLLEGSPSNRLSVLKWVFEESPAYWQTRARAGMELLLEDASETWIAIGKLVESADPDDNGTALNIFELTGDPRGPQLALKWLEDSVHPATQIETVVFLKDKMPERARAHLSRLLSHPNADYRRSAARIDDEWRAT